MPVQQKPRQQPPPRSGREVYRSGQGSGRTQALPRRTQSKRRRKAAKRRRRMRIFRRFLLAAVLLILAGAVIFHFFPPSAQDGQGNETPNFSLGAMLKPQKLVIAIDPGHGGADPGTAGNGIYEYEVTWRTASALAELLEKDGRFTPFLTITEEESQNRTTPRVEPGERTRRANEAGAVLFFSIHANSDADAASSGFECYPIPPGRSNYEKSLALGELVAQGFGEAGARLRGESGVRYIYFDAYDNRIVCESSDAVVRTDPTFKILESASCPAILCEQCFLTNASDAANFASEEGSRAAARIYYEAICAWWETQDTAAE